MKPNAPTYQTLLRYFHGRPRPNEVGVFRTTKITGVILGEEYDSIRQEIMRLIAPGIRKRNEREQQARLSRGKSEAAPISFEQSDPEADALAKSFLASLSAMPV